MADDFRSIDIDSLIGDQLRYADIHPTDPRGAQQALRDTQANATALRDYTASNDTAGALKMLLAQPPYGVQQDMKQAKDAALENVMRVLTTVGVFMAGTAAQTHHCDIGPTQ